MFGKVAYTMGPVQPEAVWDGVVQSDSMWCYPEQGKFKMRLREVHKDYSRFKSQAKKLKTWICKTFTEENQYKQYADSILEVALEGNTEILFDDFAAHLNNEIEVHE